MVGDTDIFGSQPFELFHNQMVSQKENVLKESQLQEAREFEGEGLKASSNFDYSQSLSISQTPYQPPLKTSLGKIGCKSKFIKLQEDIEARQQATLHDSLISPANKHLRSKSP